MLMTYRRRWHRVYRVILPLLKTCQKTRCVGHWTMRTNRRWGGLNTRGGFSRLGRTLLPYVGRVSHAGPLTRWIIPVYISGLLHTWEQDCDNGDIATGSDREEWRLGAAHATPRGCAHLHRSITCEPWCSVVHLQTEVVRHLLVVHLHVWLILCKLLIFNQCYGLDMHIIKKFNCFHFLQLMRQRLVRCRLLDNSWASIPPSGHHRLLHRPLRSNSLLASTCLVRELVIRRNDGL
jgi:hypothetical protein